MPSWSQLVDHIDSLPNDKARTDFTKREIVNRLAEIGKLRGDRNVIFYGSGFLQKPDAPPQTIQITHEDLNAFMSVMFEMEWNRGLTLVLHTPGGVINAAETIVAYLRSKFADIEVIVPTFAMSAGTMISLAADRIVMGRQSQLGPIDPMFVMGQRTHSARAIVDQFDKARDEILGNTAASGVWFPILQSMGPALLEEARNALEYGERMVKEWLEAYMFSGRENAGDLAKAVAHYFNDTSNHKSHGRRIDRDEARGQGLNVEDLEERQDLQEAVLTLYHLATIVIEKGPLAKLVCSDHGKTHVKNWVPTQPHLQGVQLSIPTQQRPARKEGPEPC